MSSSLINKLSLYIPTLQEELPTETTTTKVNTIDIDKLIEQQDEINYIEESSAELAYMDKFFRHMDLALRRWEVLFQGYYHATTYGVDRTFVGILNYNNELGKLLSIQFPAVEDMSSVGNPTDALSTKVIAGLEGLIGGFFEWIGEMWTKFWNWVSNIFSSEGSSGSDAANRKYHRLKESIEELLDGIDESEFDAKTWQKVVEKHQNDKLMNVQVIDRSYTTIKPILPLFAQVLGKLIAGFQGVSDDPQQVVEHIYQMDKKLLQDAQNPKFVEMANAMKQVSAARKNLLEFSQVCPNIAGVIAYAKYTCGWRESGDKNDVFGTDKSFKPIYDSLMTYSKISQTKLKSVKDDKYTKPERGKGFLNWCRAKFKQTPQQICSEFLKANRALMNALVRYKRHHKLCAGITLRAQSQALAILKTCSRVQ